MLKAYDNTIGAFTDYPGKIYDEVTGAWIDISSAKTWDANTSAWVERYGLKTELSVSDWFTGRLGNIARIENSYIEVGILPVHTEIYVYVSVPGNFVDPVIDLIYCFNSSAYVGDSWDLSHIALSWYATGYLNGSLVRHYLIGDGYSSKYTEKTYSKVLPGTMDEIQFKCVVAGPSDWDKYGLAKSYLKDVKIDGKSLVGNDIITS